LLSLDASGKKGKAYSVDLIELRPGALLERFPGGAPTEFLKMVAGDERALLTLLSHGVPRATAFPARPPYADPHAGCKDRCLGSGLVQIQLGVQDAAGNLHSSGGVLPAAAYGAAEAEFVAGCNRLSLERWAAAADGGDLRVQEGLHDLALEAGVDAAAVAQAPTWRAVAGLILERGATCRL
jgi:hypothetical protein